VKHSLHIILVYLLGNEADRVRGMIPHMQKVGRQDGIEFSVGSVVIGLRFLTVS
jgi:hypothetical protein